MARAETKSRWRAHASAVIRRVLAELPPDTSLEAKKKAISAAYPFGERAMHPYKIWLSEVRKQLGAKPSPFKEEDPRIEIVRTRLWVVVRCRMCDTRRRYVRAGTEPALKNGCLLCGPWHEELEECVKHPDWYTMRGSAIGNAGNTAILADWCDDHHWHRIADVLRKIAGRIGA